jgi:hypothetical protein
MSRLGRPFLDDRYVFATVDWLGSGSAGLALKPCGLSSSAGLFRAAKARRDGRAATLEGERLNQKTPQQDLDLALKRMKGRER